MTTKRIFSIDGKSVSTLFKNTINYTKKTRFKVLNTKGKSIANIPLLLLIVLAIILPIVTFCAIGFALILSYSVSLEQENEPTHIFIDNK